MHLKRLSGFTLIKNAQSRICKSQGCVRNKEVEELNEKIDMKIAKPKP